MVALPPKSVILDWIKDNPSRATKRDIAKAFGIKGAERIELKRMYRELKEDGIIKGRKEKTPALASNSRPPVALLYVNGLDDFGELWLRAAEKNAGITDPILYIPNGKDPALGVGDRVLCRLSSAPRPEKHIEARLIRKLDHQVSKILGIFRTDSEGGRILSIDKKLSRDYFVPARKINGAKEGELVEAQILAAPRKMGRPAAEIIEIIGDPGAPKSISLIAIRAHGIPDEFSQDALDEAAKARPPKSDKITDLRHLPLFTIDPKDARDHDDAVCAFKDDDPENPDGFVLWVAIADVAHFVRFGGALDAEAHLRGNSTYFADRVVPMLPNRLSEDLCSLKRGEERASVALRITIDANGEKRAHQFFRGIMRSRASLTYEQAQSAFDGVYDAESEALKSELQDLYAAYQSLEKAIARRAPLNLDLPERQIDISDQGDVRSVAFKERFDAHKLIEAFMVLANVCAAETLERQKTPFLYRVHEEPSQEKMDALHEVLAGSGLRFAKGQVLRTRDLNRLLSQAEEGEDHHLVSMNILRAMQQAYYGTKNFGHFGLALRKYTHFTSPIRRYADLMTHRALITAHGWEGDGLTSEAIERLDRTGTHISETERRSMAAERDTADRYLAAYLSDQTEAEFAARISGLTKALIFVKLDETGAEGIVPLRNLGREYWRFDVEKRVLKGAESRRIIAQGMPVKVRLIEVEPMSGGLTLELLSIAGQPLPKSGGSARRKKRLSPKKRGRKR